MNITCFSRFITLNTRIVVLVYCLFFLLSCEKKNTRFELLTADETGISFVNTITEKDSFNIMQDEYMYNGGGVGVGDLNKDGLPDLVFTGNKVPCRIYLNRNNFRFEDITLTAIGLDSSQWVSGVAMADVNADGWTDIYLTCTSSDEPEKRKNKLFIHQGLNKDSLPVFLNQADAYGVADTGYSVHSAFLDYDLDGDLDLYILNNITNKEVPTNYRPKITDGSAQNNDKLYRNNGNSTFTDVTKEAGIVYEGFGLGLAVGDVNKDGYPDLYISNDYIANDILYINQKNGTFKNLTEELVSYQSKFSMGNDMADVNNDGFLDIMTTDMMPESYARKKQTINGHSYNVYVYNEKYDYEPQYIRNMLHIHNGLINGQMVPYSEAGQLAGIFQTEWSWSPLFADYDNDGDKDLMVTNGFPKDLTDKDFTNYKAQVYGYLVGDYDIIPKIPIVKVSNYAFENNGELSFKDVTQTWGIHIPSFSNGASFTDLDNDGDLDYVTNNINDPAFVYRNNTIGSLQEKVSSLKIKLTGLAPNTQAIGAKVTVWAGGKPQYMEQNLSRGYISSIDPILHAGLDTLTRADSIVVIWPGHTAKSIVVQADAGKTIEISQRDATPLPVGWTWPQTSVQCSMAPIEGFTYNHQQADYIDFFQRQHIMPHKFSQAGPCMTKGDMDGDGKEDILVGGGPDIATAVYLQKGNRLVPASFKGLTEIPACLQTDMVAFDADNDGDTDVVAVSGGYANENETSYVHYLYRNNNGAFTPEELPGGHRIASVVRVADADKDGDPDLFIGSRVKRYQYPTAPESIVLLNQNGRYTADAMISLDLGMVTDAQWCDANNDGWPDIITAREWNSPALCINRKGTSFTLDKNLEKKEWAGLWYSVMPGDFDGDGDTDFIMGNLGGNHRFTLSGEHPLRLYALDIDNNGQIDPIMAACWKDSTDIMREYPVNYLDELASQSAFFRKNFTSYTRFSHSTMDEMLKGIKADKASMPVVTTTASGILWNQGATGFSWQELPRWIQVAPVKKIIQKDINKDSRPDIILAGNDHSYDVSTGRYDGSRGFILVNEGKGKFTALRPSQSGLSLTGQVESLLTLDINGASYLVAGINKKPVATYLIGPAPPPAQ